MRLVLSLALALTLTACGDDAPAVETTDTVAVEVPADPASSEALADPAPDEVPTPDPADDADDVEFDALLAEADAMLAEDPVAAAPTAPAPLVSETDARSGTLEEALLASAWRIVKGPGETLYFENDGTFQLYIGDRLVEGGEWVAEEGILYLGETDAYVIDERRETGMTFSGGPADEMILEQFEG